MSTKSPAKLLLWHRKLKAIIAPCDDAMKFALRYRRFADAWRECERADWMCALLWNLPKNGLGNLVCYCGLSADRVRKDFPKAPRLPDLPKKQKRIYA